MTAFTGSVSGGWSNSATWGGAGVPGTGDSATISAGVIVDVDQNIIIGTDVASNVAVTINGTLRVNNPAASYTLTAYGFVDIKSGGEYQILMNSQPTFTYTHQVNASASLAKSRWYIRQNSGGKTTFTGDASRVITQDTTTADSSSGTNTITTTTDNSATWKNGDTLRIFTKGVSGGNEEEKIISSIAGNVITLTVNLTNTHVAGSYILNMTRNIVVTVYNTGSTATSIGYSPTNSTLANINITWTQFEGCGSDSNYNHAQYYFAGGTSLGTIDSCAFHNSVQNSIGIGSGTPASGVLTNNVFSWKSGGVSRGHIICDAANSGITFTSNSFCGSKPVFDLNSGGYDSMTFTNLVAVGAIISPNVTSTKFTNCTFNNITSISGSFNFAEASFNNTITNLYLNNSTAGITLNGCAGNTFTNTTFVSNTADITLNGYSDNYFYNISNTPTIAYGASPIQSLKLYLEKLGHVEGTHKSYVRAGNYQKQSGTVRTATNALQITPTNASFQTIVTGAIPAVANTPIALTGFIQKDGSYGSSNLPFFRLSGLGMTTSTSTMTDTNSSWIQLTVSGTPTVDGFGLFEIVTQSATGNVFVDDVVVTGTSINTGSYDFWYKGDVPPVILATGLGANDVWNVQTSVITGTGTFGSLIKLLLTVGKFLALK